MDWSIDIGFQKMARYCAYQDRSRKELVRKLRELGCPEEKQEELIEELGEQGFWNEERFARSFVRGKFRNNRWGRVKIRQGLWEKGVEDHLVQLALEEEIKEEDYWQTVERLLEQKARGNYQLDFTARQKLFRSLASKGFELEIISEVWKSLGEGN